jgi:hypothetical protein
MCKSSTRIRAKSRLSSRRRAATSCAGSEEAPASPPALASPELERLAKEFLLVFKDLPDLTPLFSQELEIKFIQKADGINAEPAIILKLKRAPTRLQVDYGLQAVHRDRCQPQRGQEFGWQAVRAVRFQRTPKEIGRPFQKPWRTSLGFRPRNMASLATEISVSKTAVAGTSRSVPVLPAVV